MASTMTLYASGTTTATSGGVVLATTFTPAIYVLEVDVTNCPNTAVVTLVFNTSVQPVYPPAPGNVSGAYTNTDTVSYTGTGSAPPAHLFTPPRQVTTVENSPGTTWTLKQTGTGQSYDWSIYRID